MNSKSSISQSFLSDEEKNFRYGVDSFKFTLPGSIYDRTQPQEKDCYKGNPPLQNGLSDVSKCFYDFPVAASFPHFLYGDPDLQKYVNGMQPEVEKHESYVYVEPITGIPLNSRARSQSNLIIRKLDGFKEEIERFSELVIPMFWAEYNQVGLPWYIAGLVYFSVNLMPTFQHIFTAFLLLWGGFLVTRGFRQIIKSKRNHLMMNKVLQYEQEIFIKV